MTVWEALVGQDDVVDVLKAAAAAARDFGSGAPPPSASVMTHAWLFTGPPGSGRSVAARAFAAALQCTEPTEDGPGCGECTGCRSTLAGRHPDVHPVVPQGLSISVSEMRAVVAEAARRPVVGSWQAMIIEDADRLTEAASNALLKVVEEPPRRTVFLLCAPSTHPDDVTMTIRSRCRHLALRTPPAEAIAAVLTGEGAAPEMATWAAQASQGHVGRARRLVRDDDSRARRAAVLAVPERVRSLRDCQDVADALIAAAESEAQAVTDGVDEAELDALRTALGAGGTGKGTTGATRAWPARCVNCSCGNAPAPPARNATPWTARSSTWPGSTGTCCGVRPAPSTLRRTPKSQTRSAGWRRQFRHPVRCVGSRRCLPVGRHSS